MDHQSSKNVGPFSTYRGLIISIACVLAAPFLSMGCDSFRNGASGSKKAADPVEAEFDWAMERLRRAIETFTPPAGLGLRVQRQLSFEFFPPTGSKTDYTAKAIVESLSVFEPRRFTSNTDDELKEAAEESRSEAAESFLEDEFSDDRENDPTAFLDDSEENSQLKPAIVNSLVKAPSIEERIVYELAYRDERWQLITEPESEHEKLWFEYALRQ